MSELLSTFRLAAIPQKAEAFREEVRAFLKTSFEPPGPQLRARSWMGFDANFSRSLAKRGWVGVTLPREYGGADMGAFSRYVLVEELLAVGAPVAAHWIADRQSGPLILKFGNEAQRRFFLPKICAAQAFFCIGMSEPDSGSDLASVSSRAVKVQGGWRLNGRKIWTTSAQHCHFMIALVDYGSGNLRSVSNALLREGADVRLVEGPEQLDGATAIVLPGVGAFGDCVTSLHGRGLWDPLAAWLRDDRPFLGICVGYQVLFEEGVGCKCVPGSRECDDKRWRGRRTALLRRSSRSGCHPSRRGCSPRWPRCACG